VETALTYIINNSILFAGKLDKTLMQMLFTAWSIKINERWNRAGD
jgi:hypothetical protein